MIKGGAPIASRKEVAQRAGVSEATVSRVLNNVGPIKETTRQKVLAAAEELGYVQNAIAQRFALRSSRNIGVVLPIVPKVKLFSSYYFSEILSGIGEVLQEQGMDLMLHFRAIGEKMDYAHPFKAGKIDAMIILGSRHTDEELSQLRQLQELSLPFCLVNQVYPNEDFNVVDADHRRGSMEAVRHLLDQGCRRIAMLNGPLAYSNSLDRLSGYREALEAAGIKYDPTLVFTGNYSRTSGWQQAQVIVEHLDHLDAVFVANDRMAVGLMQGLKGLGVMPGRDLAIVGYDNTDAAVVCDPPLTTVEVPFHEMGRTAARRLLHLLQDASRERFHEVLGTTLVVRGSSTVN